MTYKSYDPAKDEADDKFVTSLAVKPSLDGPSGNSTLTDHNEKGILEIHLSAFTTPKQAALGSDHDSQRQGIYTSNSRGDND